MEIITILLTSVIILVILAVAIKLNNKNIRLIKKIGEDRDLNRITKKLPDNEKICKEMLSMLKNESVNIKVGDENKEASLYIVDSNTIMIANIKNTFTRVQTIAHECIHSIQDKRLLWFNFIFSNIYLMYFIAIVILTLLKKISTPGIFAIILVMISILHFFIRSYLEIDAMTKARYLAEKYMLKKLDIINKDNIDLIINNYDIINSIGIKFYSFIILMKDLVKVIIYCAVSMIKF